MGDEGSLSSMKSEAMETTSMFPEQKCDKNPNPNPNPKEQKTKFDVVLSVSNWVGSIHLKAQRKSER